MIEIIWHVHEACLLQVVCGRYVARNRYRWTSILHLEKGMCSRNKHFTI